MDNDKKKIILLVFLGVIILFGVIIVPNMLPSVLFSFKEASAVAIIGGDDGPTTIYIAAFGNWMLILYYSLLLFGIDLIALGIIKIIEYKINKNIGSKYLCILIFNIIIVLLLFQNTIIQLLILNAIVALIYLIKIFLKRVKNEPY
jgi:Na+-transporting methylmalonyl-CoA/oxaloacetate decarboxylase beta subunit